MADGGKHGYPMDTKRLNEVARAIVADGKGILAADESGGTITKRFQAIGVESTELARRDYRSLLFTTPGLETSIGGVILYDETIRQTAPDGTPIPKLLANKGIVPGIKVDKGAKPLANHPGEKVTEGLDGLADRLKEYLGMGARFAKWRAVITVGPGIPSQACISANAHALARYAALCQEGGVVPIVEPEVLMDGDHDIDACEVATRRTLEAVFAALRDQDVSLPGILLKPSMVISGSDAKDRAGPQEVARRTVQALRECVPDSVPGICFLSGGQGPEEATEHLRLMNTMGPFPWKLTFSYGRALQDPALKAWKGSHVNAKATQAALKERADANHAAALGKARVTH